MTSREFYQLIDRMLVQECKRLGLSRKPGTVSLWFVRLQLGTFFYEISKSIRHGYIPYLGGRFKVTCNITPSPDHRTRGLHTEVSYMEYFTDSDLEEVQGVRDRVLGKIVGQRPPDEFPRMMLEAHAPILQMEMGTRFNRHGVFTVPYLDAEDVSAWGAFLSSRLEQTLIGLQKNPVFFMRTDNDLSGG